MKHDTKRLARTDERSAAETTIELLALARAGDTAATERLLRGACRRSADGPAAAFRARRVASWTPTTSCRRPPSGCFGTSSRSNPRNEGALQAYLRQTLANRIRDEMRGVARRPAPSPLDEIAPPVDGQASPLEQAIGREALESYEAALKRLRPADREAIVARIELQYSYQQLALALGKPSVEAARMSVARALVRLASEMSYER